MERGVGPGLSPDPWFHCITYDHDHIYYARPFARGFKIAWYCNLYCIYMYIYIYARGFETIDPCIYHVLMRAGFMVFNGFICARGPTVFII
jgi:hypothetical protein